MDQAKKGLFISFEGIDGAGKSTHIPALAQAFKESGKEVVLTREPGGTELGEKIRLMVLKDSMDPLTESLLVFAARREHIRTVICPALERAAVVLCDRFTDATFAYQGGGRGFEMGILKQLELWVQGLTKEQSKTDPHIDQLLEPDLTLWFVLDPKVAAQRLVSARVPDRFETQPVEFFNKVHQAYLERANNSPNRFVCINADQSLQSVWEEVLKAVKDKAWL
jgi:dTMP kinase